ncbi:hypothetical protein TRIATDRAFT_139480 [Trichoderma atroviride IMI 206040]|uniref:Uncharacterized protein n=1 Tax=Hypocrea atroviridis (strain ATCC 20476 / IMI 206040) TaxID=452589 RepID=G9NV16_HYPAI|nr:uncharacterized protein TRIATDRAFT_139480 [Trichoderma atroviride IMI 206040]EHK44840.1 hypothetical protein TRIATDRAFT_139480 [Trichoderma atroviride IMI 206040]
MERGSSPVQERGKLGNPSTCDGILILIMNGHSYIVFSECLPQRDRKIVFLYMGCLITVHDGLEFVSKARNRLSFKIAKLCYPITNLATHS